MRNDVWTMRQKFHIGDASLLRSGTCRSSDWMKQIFSQSEALPRCGLAYEQALRGALVTWWEKEGGLATSSLEFEYLHRKSQSEMLIGGDDISNDIITLGTRFSMFVYIRTHFRFALIGGNLTA